MEISTISRPRNVGWARAAALLYGDWGTSKAYVIGLALAAVGYTALPHLLAVCFITGLVGLNYIWVCRCFPTGGGVYTAAGMHSRRLAAIGGLLLLADFIVTASLSCLDAFHYLGLAEAEAKKWAIVAIFAIGAMNFMGPKHSGSVAIWLAIPTVLVVLVLVAAGLPHLPQFHAVAPTGGIKHNWIAFVGMVLALSGVEAAASSTGVMRLDPGSTPDRPSVAQVSRKAVLVVMIEVVGGTALLSVIAFCLPTPAAELPEHQADLLRHMGDVLVDPWFGKVVGVVFALLLLSAVNTAIGGMIALLYVMARDGEIPVPFTQLNRFGVPYLPLVAATTLPVIVLDLTDSVENLAHLYAIGVVGAIVLNIGSASFGKNLPLKTCERQIMRGTAVLLLLIWVTIAVTKTNALVFVSIVLAAGLALREYTQLHRKKGASAIMAVEPQEIGEAVWEGRKTAEVLGQRLLVAVRGWTPALRFALEAARLRNSLLLVLYIREVAVAARLSSDWHKDKTASELFTRIQREAGDVPVHPLYSVSDAPADTITDIAATFGADTVVLGGSRRAALVKLLKGNVVTRVASHLPSNIRLVVVG
ncbi:MAG: amino acid permease [Verrucomicrobiales bacterium]|nr:amino acid permease [Verrucomicrobiales bacterium]